MPHAKVMHGRYLKQLTRVQHELKKNIEEYDDCISQHYEERSMVPEFAVAEDMMYAMLDVLRGDKDVKIYNAEHVIDIACSMAKTAIKEAEMLYDESHPQKEEK